MIADFFQFVLACFMMVVKLFRSTVIDGISYEVMSVAACMLSIVLTSIVVKFRPGFRLPKPPRSSSTSSSADHDP